MCKLLTHTNTRPTTNKNMCALCTGLDCLRQERHPTTHTQNAWFRGEKKALPRSRQMKEAFCVERERKPKSASSLSSTQISDARPGWGMAGSSRCDEPPRSGAQPPPRAVAAAETAPDLAPARGRSTVRNDGACRRPLGSPRALSSLPPSADDDISLYAPQIWKALG
jgi:hypothetical protein